MPTRESVIRPFVDRLFITNGMTAPATEIETGVVELSSAVKAVIAGLGPYGYIVAMQAALHTLGKLPNGLPAPMRLGPK